MHDPRGIHLTGLLLFFCFLNQNAQASPTLFPSETTAYSAAADITNLLELPVAPPVSSFQSADTVVPSIKDLIPNTSPLYVDTILTDTAAVVDEIKLGVLSRNDPSLSRQKNPGNFPRRIIVTHASYLSIAQRIFPEAQILVNKNYSSSLKSLRSGAVDSIICDKATAEFLMRFSQFSTFTYKSYPELHAYIFINANTVHDAISLRNAILRRPALSFRSIYEKWEVIGLAEVLAPDSRRLPYAFSGTLLIIIVIMTFILTHLSRSRHDAQKKLNDAVQFWESLIQSIPTPTLVSTPEGSITHLNTALLDYLKTTLPALSGMHVQTLSDHYDITPPLNTRLLVDAITHPQPHFTEGLLQIHGRSYSLLQWMSVIHDTKLTPKGIIIGWIDITQRKVLEKDLEEALQKSSRASEEKSRFLAQMSHELRSPLNVITGVLESVINENPEGNSLLSVAGSAANQLLATIGNILDLSKIEAGELRVNLLPTSLQTLFEEMIVNHCFLAEQKSLLFQQDISQLDNVIYMCDRVKIGQIVNNLLSNAVKYTAEGAVSLTVSRNAINAEMDELHISIRDTGIGIDQDHIPLILQPYKQVDDTAPKSTGLGLSITHQLVHLLGGKLSVESEKNVGSEFHVRLPLTVSYEPSSLPVEIHRLAPKIVLAVDDSPANLTVLSLQLSQLGHTAITATEGSRALHLLDNNQDTDIILTDCQMEPVDGYALAREVRRLEDHTGKNHFILGVTANAFSDEESACLKSGMDGVLIKPFKSDMLAQALSLYSQLYDFSLDEVIALAGNQYNLLRLLSEMSTGCLNEMDSMKELDSQKNTTMLKAAIHRMRGVYGLADFVLGTELCKEIDRQIKMNNDYAVNLLKLERANYHFCRIIDREITRIKDLS